MDLIISFCCNDDRNGTFMDRVEAIHLPDGAMELTCQMPRAMAFHYIPKAIYLGRIKLPHKGVAQWYGNWCWDGVRMEISEVMRMLNYIRGKFTCEGGWCAICDPWEAGTLTEEILRHEFDKVLTRE